MSLGPLDLAGGPFLELYATLLVAAVAAGFIIPSLMRPRGSPRYVTDPDQLAFLAGGAARFQETVTARLLAARTLVMSDRKRFDVIAHEGAMSAAERSVLALPAPLGWQEIRRALSSHLGPLEDKMIRAGLLIDREMRRRIRLQAVLPYIALIVFGAAKWEIGINRHRPVGYLTALLIVTAVLALVRWASIDRRTRAGRDALAEARHRAQRLSIAPTNPEIGLGVALFGTAVLAGSGWADFHRLRQAASSGGYGGDGGSSCGGGGGGGGGCGGGGCGGCGGG
jgi:uncharacterized protein (TIGR04222 family)